MTYTEAAHAMQAGVALDQEYDAKDGTTKHLRVSINSAQVNDLAIARLLISKGIITEAEYAEAIRVAMIDEVERYEQHLLNEHGINVILK